MFVSTLLCALIIEKKKYLRNSKRYISIEISVLINSVFEKDM